MLLLMLIGVSGTSAVVHAYATISYSLPNDGALGFSLVNSTGVSISGRDDAEGTVS